MKDVLTRIIDSKTVEDAWSILSREMLGYGFDRLLYGYTRFRTSHGLGDRDDMLVLTTHNDRYVTEFFDREMFQHAPMTQWAAANEGSMSWSYLGQIAETLTREQREIIDFNRAHGVVAGYTISFADRSERHKAAIALTAKCELSQRDVDEVWNVHGTEINLLAQVAHLRIATLPFPATMRRLSTRQREVLEWVGDGKTMQDIATIMGLTIATVEKHLRKAREALGVDTTTQAVMKASLQKQIFVTDA